MSKLQFRARALDASKPMPIYMAEELPDLTDYSAINRAVPQMPSGMEKEEECEHHLQRAICTGLIIPTPEVANMADAEAYDKIYPANYKQPRQLIHMQPFAMEQDIPDYDMDSEDEAWVGEQARRLDLTPLKFESMMDRLEKSSGQTVVTLHDAKALLKEDDDLIIAIFDYWLNKRLKTQHPLILAVKTEHRLGSAANNPYLAFRRRTEKMQTRKNRKNDETSYEKMLKLRRDLSRAVTLLEMVKRREKTKREHLHLTIEIVEKRYQAQDFSGALLSEVSALRASRPAFAPIFTNQYSNQNWVNKVAVKDEIIPRKEKRQYKKRKHKSTTSHANRNILGEPLSSDEEDVTTNVMLASPEEPETADPDEGRYAFKRNKHCSYHMPKSTNLGNWPWCSSEDNGIADQRYRYTLTSLRHPKPRCIGFARRRVGRGGRVILDRVSTPYDDLWREMDFTILETPSMNERLALEKAVSAESGEVEMPSVDNVNSPIDLNKTINYPVLNDKNISVTPALRNLYTEHNYNSTTSASGFTNNYSTCTSTPASSVCRVKSENEIDTKHSVQVKEELPWAGVFADTQPKQEPTEVRSESEADVHCTEQDTDIMLEILQEVKRDWLHFRPKTPPVDYEPPCYLLPAKDDTFSPSELTPLIIETESLLSSSALFDDGYQSTFTSEFTLSDLYTDLNLDSQLRQEHRPTSPSSSAPNDCEQLGFLLNDTRQTTELNNCSDSNNCISSTNHILNDVTQFGCSRVSVSSEIIKQQRTNSCLTSESGKVGSSAVSVKRNIQLVQNASGSSQPRHSLQAQSILSSTLTSPNKYNSSVNNSAGTVNSTSSYAFDRVATSTSSGVRISNANLVNVRPLAVEYPHTNGPSTSHLDVSIARRVDSKPLSMDESLIGDSNARFHRISNNSIAVNSQIRRPLHNSTPHSIVHTLNSNSANNVEVSSSPSLITDTLFADSASNLKMKSALLQQKGSELFLNNKQNSQQQTTASKQQNTQTNNKNTPQTNNKQQIVRKNNTLAMEVT